MENNTHYVCNFKTVQKHVNFALFIYLKGSIPSPPSLFRSDMVRYVYGAEIFQLFSAQGGEMGGDVEPTQKATLFPGGSALHPPLWMEYW